MRRCWVGVVECLCSRVGPLRRLRTLRVRLHSFRRAQPSISQINQSRCRSGCGGASSRRGVLSVLGRGGISKVSQGTGRAFEVSCGSWSCPHCARRKKAAARYLIAAGYERALARGESVRFITLTTTAGMDRRALYLAFNKLCVKLRRSGELSEYLAVLETTAGRKGTAPLLHLHLLATGRYIRQARLSRLWSWATNNQARVTDIRAVRGVGEQSAAGYLVKQLASYCVKANAQKVQEPGGARLRPVRCSRGWLPGGFTAAEKAVGRLVAEEHGGAEPDPGPWLYVIRRADGSLTVRSNADEQAEATSDDEGAQPLHGEANEEKGGGEAAQEASLALAA